MWYSSVWLRFCESHQFVFVNMPSSLAFAPHETTIGRVILLSEAVAKEFKEVVELTPAKIGRQRQKDWGRCWR